VLSFRIGSILISFFRLHLLDLTTLGQTFGEVCIILIKDFIGFNFPCLENQSYLDRVRLYSSVSSILTSVSDEFKFLPSFNI